MQTVLAVAAFKRAGVKETVVLLAIAWMIPFLVHVLPWSGEMPLGAHLLPMFWAAFASVYLFGLRTGLLVVNLALLKAYPKPQAELSDAATEV